MAAADPSVRHTAARIAALSRWSKSDGKAQAMIGQKGLMAKFEREVDPDGVLPPHERAARANRALRAHMSRLALASAKKRTATA